MKALKVIGALALVGAVSGVLVGRKCHKRRALAAAKRRKHFLCKCHKKRK